MTNGLITEHLSLEARAPVTKSSVGRRMAVQDDNAKSRRGMKSGARTDGARSGDFLTFSHLADTEGKQATCSGDGGERGTEKVGGKIGAESRERTPRLKEEKPTGQSLKMKPFIGYLS